MTETKSKWVDGVAKLTTLTQEGKLKWSVGSANAGVTATANAPFYAEHKQRRIRILKRRGRLGMMGVTVAIGIPDEYVALELVNNADNLIWTFPEVAGLEDLYRAVQYQVAGVDEILNDFLAD